MLQLCHVGKLLHNQILFLASEVLQDFLALFLLILNPLQVDLLLL